MRAMYIKKKKKKKMLERKIVICGILYNFILMLNFNIP